MPVTAASTPTVRAPHRLDPLLAPRSIALVGASARPDSNGLALAQMCTIDGFAGRVYPVNPRYAEIDGRRCFPALTGLPERAEHAVLAVGAEQIEVSLDLAIAHGARAVTIFSSCQLALDREPRLVTRVAHRALEAGIALCGPNTMGFYSRTIGLRVAGFPSPPGLRAGGIAFIAQSGSAFSALAHNDRRLGFSLCVSSGMELNVTAADYIDWALSQPTTRVIGLFLEQVRQPAAFAAALEAASQRDIPVVILKVGRTSRSAEMALSHTGALAGSDMAFVAMCRSHDVVIVDDLDELAATLLFFDQRRRPGPGALASIHDSGGERELVVDLAERLGVPYAAITDDTRSAIAPHLDPGLAPDNPLDAWGTARNFVDRFAAAFTALLDDPNVAVGAFISDVREGYWYSQGVIEATRRVARNASKPVIIATNYSKTANHNIAVALAQEGIPVLEGTRESLLAVRHAFRWRDRQQVDAPVISPTLRALADKWRPRLQHSTQLSEIESLDLLRDFGIPAVRASLASSRHAVVRAASAIGFPVAVKTAAGHAHKSDVGGVYLGLLSEAAVAAAYDEISARLGPQVLISPMAPAGVEIGMGAIIDPAFGPLVVVCAGGTLIEVLDDKAAALAPFDTAMAKRMVLDLKIAKVLKGVRGRPPADLDALAATISAFSCMIAALAGDLAEVDVNPMIVSASGALAVDALVISGKDRN